MNTGWKFLVAVALAAIPFAWSAAGNVSLGSHVGDYRSGNGGGIDATGTEVTGSGTCTGADSVVRDNNGDWGCPKLTDVAPQDYTIRCQPGFPGGAQTACDTNIFTGQDESTVVIDDFSQCALSTVTVTVFGSNGGAGTASICTEADGGGANQWDAVTSNAVSATNLATCVEAITGVGATASSATVRVTLDTNTGMVTLARNVAACATASTGTFGFVDINGIGSVAYLRIVRAGDTANAFTIGGGTWGPASATQYTQSLNMNSQIYNAGGTNNTTLFHMQWNTTQTPDTMIMGLGTTSRSLLFIEGGDQATDFAKAQQTNPTVCVQSADQTSVTERICSAHDGTDAIISVDSGDLGIQDDGGKGVTTYVRTNTEVLTFAANPGDATKVTSALCPAGRPIMGITTRVRTTATNCTSVQIGDGTDADMFSSATSGITAGTTTGPANYTAYSRIGIGQAAFNVTVTANGGNCFTGVWAVTCHYIEPAAATAN